MSFGISSAELRCFFIYLLDKNKFFQKHLSRIDSILTINYTAKNMKYSQDLHKKLISAFDLVSGTSISVAAFESVRELVKGFHPGLDEKLEVCSKALDTLQKIENFDVISLSVEHLPEESEKQKKRKKALLFFINCVKDLQSEIKRVDAQMNQSNGSVQNNLSHFGTIVKYARGPLGFITLVAVVIVVFVGITGNKAQKKKVSAIVPSASGNQIQVITYNGKQIPLSQLFVGHGPDCDSPHYHAISGTVTTLDKTKIQDPEGCGFGKVSVIQVHSISAN